MTSPTDDEILARMRGALDELAAGIPTDAPALDDRSYMGSVVSMHRRRWPVAAAVLAVAAAAAVAAVVVGTRDNNHPPAAPTSPSPAPAPTPTEPATTAIPPPTTGALPKVTLDLPGAAEDPSQAVDEAAPELAPTRIYASDGLAADRVLVVQTTQSEYDPPSPEGDYTMDPVGAPTGRAWILHPVLDEPGNHVPIDQGSVWWSTGNGRELVMVSGHGFTDAELIAVLPDLHLSGDSWAWTPAAGSLPEVPRGSTADRRSRLSQTVLADGQRATIIVQTGTRWDLLFQSSSYLAVTDRPATATVPGGTTAVVRADPGNHHLFWLERAALVHLSVPMSEDLDAILAAVRIAP